MRTGVDAESHSTYDGHACRSQVAPEASSDLAPIAGRATGADNRDDAALLGKVHQKGGVTTTVETPRCVGRFPEALRIQRIVPTVGPTSSDLEPIAQIALRHRPDFTKYSLRDLRSHRANEVVVLQAEQVVHRNPRSPDRNLLQVRGQLAQQMTSP
jgi:hypothetical protein